MSPRQPPRRWEPSGVAVIDAAVSDRGWRRVDFGLAQVFSGADLRATMGMSSGLGRRREARGADGAHPPGQGATTRVGAAPREAFVAVGGRSRREGGGRAGDLVPGANDNKPVRRWGTGRPFWRDLVFLVLLAATVAGAFWSGRLHAGYTVIVVPEASSSRSRVT